MRYRQKVNEIDAILWDGSNIDEVKSFGKQYVMFDFMKSSNGCIPILKLKISEEIIIVPRDSYIIKNNLGMYTHMPKFEFEYKYEPVKE
jgi:hypothetical protein